MFNVLGAIFNQGSTFAVNIIVANLMGKWVFGEYAMVQSTLSSLAIISQFGIGYTATKYIAEFRTANPYKAGRILGLLTIFSASAALVVGLALLCASRQLAITLRAPSLAPALAIASVVLLFAVMNGFLMGSLAGLEAYRAMAVALIWCGVTYLLICAGCARLGGLNGAVLGLGFSGLIQTIVLVVTLKKECVRQGIAIQYSGLGRERNVILRFSLPAGLSGCVSAIALWFLNIFLTRRPDGYSQLALYGASYSLMAMVLFLPGLANTVGMSLINHQKGASQTLEYRKTFWLNLAVTIGIVAIGVVGLTILGPGILRLFGKDFRGGYSILIVLLAASIPQGIALALVQIIQSQGEMWRFLGFVAIPRDCLMVGLGGVLISRYGAKGAATAYLTAWIVAALATASLVYQHRYLIKYSHIPSIVRET